MVIDYFENEMKKKAKIYAVYLVNNFCQIVYKKPIMETTNKELPKKLALFCADEMKNLPVNEWFDSNEEGIEEGYFKILEEEIKNL